MRDGVDERRTTARKRNPRVSYCGTDRCNMSSKTRATSSSKDHRSSGK
jgi:hypothetical protein